MAAVLRYAVVCLLALGAVPGIPGLDRISGPPPFERHPRGAGPTERPASYAAILTTDLIAAPATSLTARSPWRPSAAGKSPPATTLSALSEQAPAGFLRWVGGPTPDASETTSPSIGLRWARPLRAPPR